MKAMPEILPDGFTGAICAIEGIEDAAVLLNGPTGCKFFHGAVSEGQYPRADSMNPLKFSEEFYFGQPRIPATYLDDHDYVFGATYKLEKILPFVAKKGHRLIAIINSPGASLIGDDLKRFIKQANLGVPSIAIESCGFSESFAKGFENALIEAIKEISPRPFSQKKDKRVNLIGISVFNRFWEGNLAILTELLNLCKIRVNCVLACGCSVDDIKNLGKAGINLVIHREQAKELASFLSEFLSLEAVFPEMGAPIGFEATKSWIIAACEKLGADPGPALESLQNDHKRIKTTLGRFYSLTGLPKGVCFAIAADGSIALPLTTWLYNYLGMVPVYVKIYESGEKDRHRLEKFLQSIGCANALETDVSDIRADVAFGSQAFISGLALKNSASFGINTAFPGDGYIDVVPKGFMGGKGALWLIEKILNGLNEAC